ncbi:Acetyltransferase [Rhodococcus sp. RD6.2]|uniref:GNAT family N-acetyltransferase n=1 Tax=Rhodococcus sp. RD6.2 TaxID=260936 RepID=UPI00063B6FAE|nr:GNAT family N-acetyltransferase [Rhodococcus sp. RD6.2]CRK54016.1 Acetyltransferase [Rhodococcus sp. RD6.2]
MISYRWCDELAVGDRDEVLALVRRAADFDAEAGFSAVDPRDVDTLSSDAQRVWHLPIKARRDLSARDDAPWVVVAYLRLVVGVDGLGSVQFVVDPDYRSRGIATLLVEELGLDTMSGDGWAGTGARVLRVWSYGSHPAAERLTTRFGVPAVRRQWTLLRHLSGPWAEPLDPVTTEATLSEPVAATAIGAEMTELLAAATVPRRHRDSLSRADDSGLAITASLSGEPAGYVRFDPALHEHEELRAAWLGALVVSDRASGRGLGSALLVRALVALRDAGAQVALMRIDPDDERVMRMCRLLSFEQDEAHACYQVEDLRRETENDLCKTLTHANLGGSVL